MIWLIGSKGMLGSEIARHLTQNKIPWIGTNSEVDISDFQTLENFEKSIETSSYYPSQLSHAQRKVQWIINCAGFTDIDGAESEIEKNNQLNITGVQNIARLCRDIGAKLIHFSTAYVFDGNSTTPYTEDSEPCPINVYGKSKLQSEIEIERLMNTYYIIRTSWLYGASDKNLVRSIMDKLSSEEQIKAAGDQKGCPTNCSDLAEAVLKLIEKSEGATSLFGKNSAPNYGIYNYSNNGQTTWYEFSAAIKKFGLKYNKLSQSAEIVECTSEEYEQKAKRPTYSVLNKDKITKTLKLKIPAWDVSLEKYIRGR